MALKTLNGIAVASVKSVDGILFAAWKTWNGVSITHGGATNSLLLETGDHLLLENSDTLQLES